MVNVWACSMHFSLSVVCVSRILVYCSIIYSQFQHVFRCFKVFFISYDNLEYFRSRISILRDSSLLAGSYHVSVSVLNSVLVYMDVCKHYTV